MPYRPTEKTEARKAEIRSRLLECAMRIVASDGFGGLTIHRLAREAGIATGAVYKHFDSKAQLCAELFRLAVAREVEVVREKACGSGSPARRLLDAVAAFALRAIRGRRLAYALIAEPVDPGVEGERLRYRREYASIFEALIAEGVRDGQFPDQNTSVSAAALVGVVAEALIGPLAEAQAQESALVEESLVRSIQTFGLRAIALRDPDDIA